MCCSFSHTRGFYQEQWMQKIDRLSYQLERAILNGEYQPGDRLPAERLLASLFGTSRNRIREAITRLETLGLLKTEPQSGTYVCDYQKEASFDLLMYLMENHEALDPEVFHSMMQVREMMESAAVGTIAESEHRLTYARRLQEISGRIRDAAPDQLDQIMELDYQFHRTIVEGSGNIIFCSLFRTSRTVHRYYTQIFYSHQDVMEETLRQHQVLAQAITSGVREDAVLAIRSMLTYGSERVGAYIGIDLTGRHDAPGI